MFPSATIKVDAIGNSRGSQRAVATSNSAKKGVVQMDVNGWCRAATNAGA